MWKLLLNFIPGIGPFFSAATTFIADHWKFFVIAGMVGLIAYQNTQQHRWLLDFGTIPYWEDVAVQRKVTIDQLTAALNTATASNVALTASITALNADVADWKTKTDQLQAQTDGLKTNEDIIRKNYDAKIQAILNAPAPSNCKDSIDYLRQHLGGLSWQTQ